MPGHSPRRNECVDKARRAAEIVLAKACREARSVAFGDQNHRVVFIGDADEWDYLPEGFVARKFGLGRHPVDGDRRQ